MELLWVFSHGAPLSAVDWGVRAIATVDMRGRGYVWSDTGAQKKAEFPLGMVHPNVVRVSPSGSRLAVGGSALGIYSIAGGRLYVYRNTSMTNDLVWLNDGRILAVQNKGLLLLRPHSDTVVEVPNRRGCPITSVALDPSGRRFATGTCDGFVDVWFLDTLVAYRTLKFNSPVADIHWTKDGRRLLVATDDGIYIYSTDGWREMGMISHGTYGVEFVSASPDGRFVIYGGKDKIPRLYDVRKNVIYEGTPLFHWIMDGDWEEAGFRFVVVDAEGQGRVYRVKPEILR
ncbi:MAG: WD40 repeat domain-containing protein [Thermotogae bacterium]|nr:WD40 repeat domain-containing protein [Thermotogota bacterium]